MRNNSFLKKYQHLRFAFFIPLVLNMGIAVLSCAENSVAQTEASSTFLTSTENSVTQTKASSALLAQVALREQQIASPTTERLAQMQALGMQTENIGVQRIFIYLSQQLTTAQAEELNTLGITLYLDSWIPPVGNHPTGFILADMPVDKIDTLAAKDYVIKLDTAEIQAEPQSAIPEIKPQ